MIFSRLLPRKQACLIEDNQKIRPVRISVALSLIVDTPSPLHPTWSSTNDRNSSIMAPPPIVNRRILRMTPWGLSHKLCHQCRPNNGSISTVREGLYQQYWVVRKVLIRLTNKNCPIRTVIYEDMMYLLISARTFHWNSRVEPHQNSLIWADPQGILPCTKQKFS